MFACLTDTSVEGSRYTQGFQGGRGRVNYNTHLRPSPHASILRQRESRIHDVDAFSTPWVRSSRRDLRSGAPLGAALAPSADSLSVVKLRFRSQKPHTCDYATWEGALRSGRLCHLGTRVTFRGSRPHIARAPYVILSAKTSDLRLCYLVPRDCPRIFRVRLLHLPGP